MSGGLLSKRGPILMTRSPVPTYFAFLSRTGRSQRSGVLGGFGGVLDLTGLAGVVDLTTSTVAESESTSENFLMLASVDFLMRSLRLGGEGEGV